MQAIRRVMDFTHMEHMLHKPMTGLSKGMKQRLCLGRALVHNPKVLILDEPAAGLDPRARIELKEMIKTLAADGKSLLISSHILTELAEMCDRVAIIEKGELLAEGTVSEILRRHMSDSAVGSESLVPVVISVVDEIGRLDQWLGEVKQLTPLRLDGNLVEVDYSDDPVCQSEFLAELIKAGFRISGFAARQRSLEEAFLRVTKGHVQ
jgi:ABC-2 type transport system ATP-binding protein